MNCSVCGRSSDGAYCERHDTAYKSLVERFKDWQTAMGINWEKFLEEVRLNPNTGAWAKEVATHILEKGAEGR
jgi:hypothetical protein